MNIWKTSILSHCMDSKKHTSTRLLQKWQEEIDSGIYVGVRFFKAYDFLSQDLLLANVRGRKQQKQRSNLDIFTTFELLSVTA